MSYNSIDEYYEKSLKPQMNEAMKECTQDFLKCAEKIRQDAENDLARIERGEAITEWIRG